MSKETKPKRAFVGQNDEKRFKPGSYYGNQAYFKAANFPTPAIMVTEEFREEETQFSKPGRSGKKKPKLILYCIGEELGFVLSDPHIRFFTELTGSAYADDWVGLQIEVFNDMAIRSCQTKRLCESIEKKAHYWY
jgi:hypothetical protein